MRYELKQGESLEDLLTYAGSRTANAFMDLVQVKHLGTSEVELIDVQASELGQFVLTDLDEVMVPVAQRSMERFVNVMGAVKQPGLYQYVEGMSAKALIDLAGGLHKDALLTRAYVRYEEEDKSSSLVAFSLSEADAMTLASKHELIVSFKPDVDAGFTVSIRGAVQTTSDQPFSEGMTLGDMIQMAGGLIPSADYSRIEISRLKAFDDFVNGVNLASNIDVETISLPSLVSRHDLSDKVLQFKLQPFDLIVVREIPEYHMQEMVTLSGEVRYPGAYPLMHKDEQISSVIERAGGLTSYSDVANAAFTRASNPNMVLHLEDALAKTSSKFNYRLQPGDEIHVPLKQSMVSIEGIGHEKYSFNQNLVVNGPVLNNKRANAYINRYALGFAKKAHRSRLFVSYPNGDVDRTVHYGLFLLYPKVKPAGTIHILIKPEKEKKDDRDVEPLDINQVIGTLAATMSSFATMYMLITR
jgi:protein involved in polysaccharide export with SLBB domain